MARKKQIFGGFFAVTSPEQTFHFTEEYFKKTGKIIGLKERENLLLKNTRDIERRLKIRKPLHIKLEMLRKRRKIRNGLI